MMWMIFEMSGQVYRKMKVEVTIPKDLPDGWKWLNELNLILPQAWFVTIKDKVDTQKMIPRTHYPNYELLIICQAFELHNGIR